MESGTMPKSWLDTMAEREAKLDVLTRPQRIWEAFAIVIIFLIASYFIYSQVHDTGFFTSAFGPTEEIAFYGSLFFGIVPPLARMIVGKRNAVRPLDIVGAIVFIVAASYLLGVWPFNFDYFAAALPQSLQFLFDWLDNDLAMLLIEIGIFISAIVAVWTVFQYIVIRNKLNEGRVKPTQ